MQMPRVFSSNDRHTSAHVRTFPPLVERKPSKLCNNNSFIRRSFYRKFTIRRSFRANPRKRAFTPCSPYTALAAKRLVSRQFFSSLIVLFFFRKNLDETFRDVSISDY